MKVLVTAALAILTSHAAFAEEGSIKIAMNEWTGQNITAKITGAVLEEMGHSVEYVTAGAVPQFAALADGSLHISPEIWTNNVGEIFPKAIETGDIVVIGSLGIEPKEGWFYPPYMEEACPGLPNYDALFSCAQAFASAETFPNGRLITYPADWGTRSKDLVAGLGLPFQPVPGGSEGAMLAEMKSALATEQPLLMMFWEPHWIHATAELNLVEWDASDADCAEPLDQTRGNACGFQRAEVQKVVARDVAEKWPDAFAMLEKLTISNATQNALILEVDQEGKSVEDAVSEWLAENQAVWTSWQN
ncbi:MAG: ABC transporter substrate-binding protein [Sulfitobacter sp.]